MKKSKLLVSLLATAMVVGMSGCKKDPLENEDQDIVAVYKAYQANAEAKGETPLSYEDWLKSVKGEKGDKGDKGDDGATPTITIGDNGNWYVNGVDTGKKAQGEKGEPGTPGAAGTNGTDGTNGTTPTITIGDNGNWYVNGVDTGKPSKGADATAPKIEVGFNGNWFVDGRDTGSKAVGTPGENGETPVITVNDDGYWCVNGVSMGVKAHGDQGDKGEQGDKGDTGASAYEIFKKYYPHYTGDERQYAIDLANGNLANVPMGHEGLGTFTVVDSVENPGNVDLVQHCPQCDEDVVVVSAVKKDNAEFEKSDVIPGWTAPNTYPFTYDAENNRMVTYDFKGNNVSGSVHSYAVINITKKGVFSFDYDISNFIDPLLIYKNETTGNKYLERITGLSTDPGKTGTLSYEAEAGDYFFFDYSTTSRNSGRDNAIITFKTSNFEYNYLKFDSKGGSYVDPVLLENGKYLGTLPTPTQKNKFFEGWYKDAAFTEPVDADTVFTGSNPTAYAKWSNAAVAVLYPNGGLIDATEIQFRKGTTPNIPTPEREGFYFQGWYKDAAFTEPYVAGNSDKGFALYAKWFDLDNAHVLAGNYDGFAVYGSSGGYGGGSFSATSSNKGVTIDVDGKYHIRTTYSSYLTGDLANNAVDGKYATSDANVGDVIAAAPDFLIVSEKANFDSSSYIHFVVKDAAASTTGVKTALINEKKLAFIQMPYGDGVATTMIDYDAKTITPLVDVVDLDGNAVDITKLTGSNIMNFEVKKGNSVLATYHFTAAGKYSTTASMPYGVYTNGDARVEFSGAGKALFEGSVIDITSMGSNQYYGSYSASVRKVFTLNDADKEFTVADRTIVVYLDLNYAGAPQPEELVWLYDTYNSVPSSKDPTRPGYVFAGWYDDDMNGNKITGTVKFTEDTPLFAYWEEAKTLTVYNNNGGTDPAVSYFKPGTTPSIPEPTKDGFVFAGWYTDAALTTPYVSEAKNDDVTVYAKFVSTPAFIGRFYGFNSDNDGTQLYDQKTAAGSVGCAYSFNMNGSVTGKATTTWKYTDYDETKNSIKLGNNSVVMFAEADDGTLFEFVDYSVGTSHATDDDMYIAVKSEDEGQFVQQTLCWLNGYQKIIKLSFNGGTEHLIYINGYNASTNPSGGNAFVDVTLKDGDGNALTFADLASKSNGTTTFANDICIYKNDVLVGRCGGNGTALTMNDLMTGSYTGTYNGKAATLTLDGYGAAHLEAEGVDVDCNYTIPEAGKVYLDNGDNSVSFNISGNTMTQVLDGYQGAYSVFDENDDFVGFYDFTGYGTGDFENLSSEHTALTYSASGDSIGVVVNGVSKAYRKVVNGTDLELHEIPLFTVTNNGTYAWSYDSNTNVWTSSNKGVNISECVMTITANGDVTINIEFWASSEAADKWDYFYIEKNGTKLFTAGGKDATLAGSLREETITLKAGDVLVLKYVKDGSGVGGADEAYITGLVINGVQYAG